MEFITGIYDMLRCLEQQLFVLMNRYFLKSFLYKAILLAIDITVPKPKGDTCLIFKIKQKVLNELSSISKSNIRSADRISVSKSNIRSTDRITISRLNTRSADRISISRSNIRSQDSNSNAS